MVFLTFLFSGYLIFWLGPIYLAGGIFKEVLWHMNIWKNMLEEVKLRK
jgi:hypothetical protein